MRRVVCERLASLMCVNTPRAIDTMDIDENSCDVNISNNVKDLDLSSLSAAARETAAEQSLNTVERLLVSMNNLLETKLRSDARLHDETDKNQQMMNEWMIAAAVIDRFCFIIFVITLVVSSLIFALLLFFHAA